MNRLVALVLATSLVVGTSRSAVAQTDAGPVLLALSLTPYAALPPVVAVTMLDAVRSPAAVFELRYGRHRLNDGPDPVGTYGVGASFPARFGRGGFALGLRQCRGCDDVFMVGVDFNAVLAQRRLGAELDVGVATAGVRPNFGVARSDSYDESVVAVSAALDAPISIALNLGPVVQLVPFLTPGFGLGYHTTGGESESGWRFALGGGVGLFAFRSRIGLNAGFRKVFVERGLVTWGAGLTIAG